MHRPHDAPAPPRPGARRSRSEHEVDRRRLAREISIDARVRVPGHAEATVQSSRSTRGARTPRNHRGARRVEVPTRELTGVLCPKRWSSLHRAHVRQLGIWHNLRNGDMLSLCCKMLRNCKLIFLLIQMITYFCRSDGHGFHTGGCRLFLFTLYSFASAFPPDDAQKSGRGAARPSRDCGRIPLSVRTLVPIDRGYKTPPLVRRRCKPQRARRCPLEVRLSAKFQSLRRNGSALTASTPPLADAEALCADSGGHEPFDSSGSS